MGTQDVIVTKIQRMCFSDGPGIRTTVFLKGCNLHCPWCANPENIDLSPQEYTFKGKTGTYGKLYSCDELLAEVLKDSAFYGDDGGVTFSGGEPLLQIKRLVPLLKELNTRDISTAVETALQVDSDIWKCAIDLIDHFIVDLKIMDPEICKSVLGGDADCYEHCFEYLEECGKDITVRIPLNYEYTMQDENVLLIEEFLKKHLRIPVEIFATHNLGTNKYMSLQMNPPDIKEVTSDALESFAERLIQNGSAVNVIRL